MSKGLVIDIDGVLIHGVAPISGARATLLQIASLQIPHVFVTNGGGVPRADKARSLAKILGMDSDTFSSRLCSAHDPIPDMLRAEGLFEQRVLVLSKSEAYSRGVAKEWGLPNSCVLEDFLESCPWLWPLEDDGREIQAQTVPRVAAICVVATPKDWGQSLQLCCDLLANGGRLFQSSDDLKQPSLFVSNPDFDYRARAPLVRMTTGAWLHCLEALFSKYSSNPLNARIAGKPHAPIYELAKKVLGEGVKKIYCIGDNPGADIRGAIDNGFIGVLVLSGCATENDPNHPANIVAKDVSEAFEMIMKH